MGEENNVKKYQRSKVAMLMVDPDGSVRGSFVNLVMTIVIFGLIVAGAFVKSVALNLNTMSTLIIGVFGASFGIWAAKQGYTGYNQRKLEEARYVATRNGQGDR